VPRCWNPEAHAFASEALFVITQGEIGAEKVDAASIEDRNRRTAERRWRDWFDRKQNQGGK
jgi:hypothetical protein